MPFFEGSPAEAIGRAKEQRSLLVVTVQDSQDDSVRMDKELWNDEAVKTRLESVVALRMHLDSHGDDIKNFVVFYPVAIFPTVYLIGNDGMVIECFFGFKSAREFVEVFDRAQSKVSNLQSTSVPAAPAPAAEPAVAHGQSAPTNEVQQSTPSLSNLTEAEKKAKLQEAIERARRKREEDEKEREKQMENTRVEMGKRAQELKRAREAQELKSVAEETKLERKKEQEERARMKALLEADRQERIARRKAQEAASGAATSEGTKTSSRQEASDADERKRLQALLEKDKAERKKLADARSTEGTAPAPTPMSAQEEATAGGFQALRESKCTVAIRLTNGETIRQEFSGSDTLADIQSYVDANRTDGTLPYTLMTNFPRRVFHADDMDLSLAEVQLVPTGTLILTRRVEATGSTTASAGAATDDGTCGGLPGRIWGAMKWYLGYGSEGQLAAAPRPGDTPTSMPARQTEVTHTGDDRRTAGSRRSGAVVGRNVHGLSSLRNEEVQGVDNQGNRYWNGNSTQFGGDDNDENAG